MSRRRRLVLVVIFAPFALLIIIRVGFAVFRQSHTFTATLCGGTRNMHGVYQYEWLSDSTILERDYNNIAIEWNEVDATSGAVKPLKKLNRLMSAYSQGGVEGRIDGITLSPDRKELLWFAHDGKDSRCMWHTASLDGTTTDGGNAYGDFRSPGTTLWIPSWIQIPDTSRRHARPHVTSSVGWATFASSETTADSAVHLIGTPDANQRTVFIGDWRRAFKHASVYGWPILGGYIAPHSGILIGMHAGKPNPIDVYLVDMTLGRGPTEYYSIMPRDDCDVHEVVVSPSGTRLALLVSTPSDAIPQSNGGAVDPHAEIWTCDIDGSRLRLACIVNPSSQVPGNAISQASIQSEAPYCRSLRWTPSESMLSYFTDAGLFTIRLPSR